ncbi:hypothetical protein GCM10020254_77630 [Streptomyces goshikiensis]
MAKVSGASSGAVHSVIRGRERPERGFVFPAHPIGQRVRVLHGLVGEGQDQPPLGTEALYEGAGYQADLPGDRGEGQTRGADPPEHLGRRPQDHRVLDPSRTSDHGHHSLIN